MYCVNLGLTLVLLTYLLTGCVSAPNNEAGGLGEGGFGGGGSRDLVGRVIPGSGARLDESHRKINEEFPSFKAAEESATKAASDPAKGGGKAIIKPRSGTAKGAENSVQDRKPPDRTVSLLARFGHVGAGQHQQLVPGSNSANSFQNRIDEFLTSLKKAA